MKTLIDFATALLQCAMAAMSAGITWRLIRRTGTDGTTDDDRS
ncbi:hypothetical protein [Streptomyces aidingensis]|uniref:Uncharacterized protein n=1 Tax=Streptomyces aidingensis TaxID=910347 RepID=A0A1I1KEA0_9ACTN|nr:hypothetical protein [Streptomyces aidingensis]SFC58951.1 hypothetical protein SAMN05421773_104194 [Streptomyces aidingensis]